MSARIKAAFQCLLGRPTIYGIHESRIDLAPATFKRSPVVYVYGSTQNRINVPRGTKTLGRAQ